MLTKNKLLTEHWMQPSNFNWLCYQKSAQKIYLRLTHISGSKYGSFKRSQKLGCVVCVPCALVAHYSTLNNHGKMTTLGQLVVTPLRSYQCLTGKDSLFDSHLARAYHKDSTALAKNFLKTITDKVEIRGRIDTAAE